MAAVGAVRPVAEQPATGSLSAGLETRTAAMPDLMTETNERVEALNRVRKVLASYKGHASLPELSDDQLYYIFREAELFELKAPNEKAGHARFRNAVLALLEIAQDAARREAAISGGTRVG